MKCVEKKAYSQKGEYQRMQGIINKEFRDV
jgi:hypothetical protein